MLSENDAAAKSHHGPPEPAAGIVRTRGKVASPWTCTLEGTSTPLRFPLAAKNYLRSEVPEFILYDCLNSVLL